MMQRKDEERTIDNIVRERKQARFNQHDIARPKWRHLGKQSLMDVPVDVPLEKIMRDQAGMHHAYGEPWLCPKCGAKFLMGLPPDYCPVCKTPSFIVQKKVNLRA